ncbi:MAG: hypothetical protein AAFR02_09430, partial [Pseudomonadota bacterium]
LAEASIQYLLVSLVFQPSLILQLRDKTIPVGGPLSGGYSSIAKFMTMRYSGEARQKMRALKAAANITRSKPKPEALGE